MIRPLALDMGKETERLIEESILSLSVDPAASKIERRASTNSLSLQYKKESGEPSDHRLVLTCEDGRWKLAELVVGSFGL